MDKDRIKRLRAYAECCDIEGAYTEANCLFEAIEYIKSLESIVERHVKEI